MSSLPESILARLKDIRFITIGKKEYDLVEELSINEDVLDEAFRTQPERFAFWSRVLARERARLRKLEDEFKSLESDLFVQYWHAHEEEARAFSDTLIWSFVNQNEDVIAKRKEIRLSRKKVDDVKTVCDAFDHRKSAMLHLGATRRREEEVSIRSRR